MQKRIFLSAALGLAMFANTAFAEVNTDYLANELSLIPAGRWRYIATQPMLMSEHSLILTVMLSPCCKGEINFM